MRREKLVLWTVVVCLMSVMTVRGQEARQPATRENSAAAQSAAPEAPISASTDQSQSSALRQPTAQAAVPQLIKFSGTLANLAGKPVSGAVDVTFSLYSQESGGTPLWFETQTVEADSLGRCSVLLGAMTPTGVPMELFTSGEAHWLGVQVSNLPEQARVLLVSVPYAMKAGDAQTLGGRPASAYQLTSNCSGDVSSPDCGTASGQAGGGEDAAATGATAGRMTARKGTTTARGQEATTNATKRSITPLAVTSGPTNFSGATTDQIVGVTQTGSGTAISAAAPSNDVIVGTSTSATGAFAGVKGVSNSPNGAGISALLTATGGWALYGRASATTGPTVAAQGINDSDQGTAMSGWERATSGATIGLVGSAASTGGIGLKGRAYATSGNTTGILATVSSPAGTGLVINNIAGGKLFSGQLNGVETISMTASGTLNLPQTNGSGVGVITLGGAPFIHTCCGSNNNTFLGLDAGNLATTADRNTGLGTSALAVLSNGTQNTAVGAYALIGNTSGFTNTAVGAYALYANVVAASNTAVGWGALDNDTADNNTAVGWNALGGNTIGTLNTAMGLSALGSNTSGGENSALGDSAGYSNTTGGDNTFLGANTEPSSGYLSNAAAIGAKAQVGESNAMVLGSINGVNGATASVKVGIGTTVPTAPLTVGPNPSAPFNSDELVQIAKTNDAYLTVRDGAGAALLGTTSGVPFAGSQGNTAFTLRSNNTNRVWITSAGSVGIATASPDNTLSVNGTADKTGGGSWGTFSDARLKTVHGGFHAGLGQVLKLKPIFYQYKHGNALGLTDYAEHVGVVAQEVQKVIPEAVSADSKGFLVVNNDPIIWAMLNAIKEQQQEISGQMSEIRQLKRVSAAKDVRLEALAAQNRRLASKVEQLDSRLRGNDGLVAALEARLSRDEAEQRAVRAKLARAARRQKKQWEGEIARVKF